MSKSNHSIGNPNLGIEKLVSAEEIAPFVGMTERTVLNRYHDGIFPGYRIKKLIRFDLAEVMAAIRSTRNIKA